MIVSGVNKDLNDELWHPNSFAKDFGEIQIEFVDCTDGKPEPLLPMRIFWKGFENIRKRPKDSMGNRKLLKLKDWPAEQTFAEYLPSRYFVLILYI